MKSRKKFKKKKRTFLASGIRIILFKTQRKHFFKREKIKKMYDLKKTILRIFKHYILEN